MNYTLRECTFDDIDFIFDVSHIERGSCIDKEIGQTGVEIYGQAN